MSVIKDKTAANPSGLSVDWSEGILLTVAEVWQNRGSVPLSLASGASKPTENADGVLLQPGESITFGSGVTVYHRRNEEEKTGYPGGLSRTGVTTS